MAVKVIPLDANVQIQKQILAELEILHRCDSQFIIQYFGSFFNENRIMMCTEHMDGVFPAPTLPLHSPELVDPHDWLPLTLSFELRSPPLQLGPLRARIVAPRVGYERVNAVEGCGERLDIE